jgi:2,4-dienoyl-CoA reductase-like NADH-dependent reductase (Old Yellow Enzyme family)
MCQCSAEGGLPNDWHLIHLGQLALSGAGLLILEATAVSPQGRISPCDLGLYSDETEEAFGRLLKGVRLHSAMPLTLQLAHAGRKASSRAPWEGGAQIRPDESLWVGRQRRRRPYRMLRARVYLPLSTEMGSSASVTIS